MARTEPASERLTRRTKVVWLSFFAAMTVVMGLLALGESGFQGGFLVATQVGALGEDSATDPLLAIDAPLDVDRWSGIVIHHLGAPAGDPERIHRLHQQYGYQGLGYHFLIGNGAGLGDGIVHVGYRWNEQLPGAHVAKIARDSAEHNARSIGICLIGNGDRRPFTDKQMASLVDLVRRLQHDLELPADRVFLHRDLADDDAGELTSPGRFFPAGRFQTQLLD